MMHIFSLMMLYHFSSAAATHMAKEKGHFTDESNFLSVVKVPAFVDKSLMLEHVFHGIKKKLITAPPRFGKSTNLDMLKTFFSIPTGNTTALETRKVFERLNIYRKTDFVNRHLGKHPVLHISFKTTFVISSFDRAVDMIRFIIHTAFTQYAFLCDSKSLTKDNKELCKSWLGELTYGDLHFNIVVTGLSKLAEFMNKHFNGQQVLILIDEYDSLIANSMFYVNTDTLNEIIGFFIGILRTIVEENPYSDRAVITGVSCVIGSRRYGLKNIKIYKFLDDHIFTEFYGFTGGEVDNLFANPLFDLTQNRIEEAKHMYNGYHSKCGRLIYNPFSVLNFLEDGTAKNYWANSGYLEGLRETFKIPEIRGNFEGLLEGKTLKIDIADQMYNIVSLKNMFDKGRKNPNPNHHLFFSHLLELGYLTYAFDPAENTTNTCHVRIPNKEIGEYLWIELKEFYITSCQQERDHLNSIDYAKSKVWLTRNSSFLKTCCNKIMNVVFKIGQMFHIDKTRDNSRTTDED